MRGDAREDAEKRKAGELHTGIVKDPLKVGWKELIFCCKNSFKAGREGGGGGGGVGVSDRATECGGGEGDCG